MKKYSHIIWDWNGTLLDDARLLKDIVNNLLIRCGKDPLLDETHRELFGFPVVNYYIRMGFDFTSYPFEQICIDFTDEYYSRVKECRLRKDAIKVLSTIRDKGYTQSILSASRDTSLARVLEHFKVREFFEDVVGLDNHSGGTKLDTGSVFIREKGLDPTGVILIGDTVHDFEVARGLGTDVLLLDSGYQTRARLCACGCPVIDTLPSVLQHVTDSG